MQKIRVNVRSRVNNADIRWEKRNGREYIVVPSATLPDNVVMNGGLYPAEEIEKSYLSLNGTLAPFGHPKVNGVYVSALHPAAINEFHVGASNEKARREGGRVFVDKAIDIETAKLTENGRRVLDAINKGDPIHTSTGIMLEQDFEASGEGYDWTARNMFFDHDAILLDEVGAATPEQGVGMMVNSDNSEQEITVLNFSLEECAEEEMEYAAMRMAEAMYRMDTAKALDGIKDRILGAVRGIFGSGGGSSEPNDNGADGLSVNSKEGDTMPITEEQFNELAEQVKALNSALEGQATAVSEAVGEAVKPLNDKIEALETNQRQAEEVKRTELTSTIVNAGLLDEEDTKEMSINALTKLAAKAKPGIAHNMAGGMFQPNADDDMLSDELPGGDA